MTDETKNEEPTYDFTVFKFGLEANLRLRTLLANDKHRKEISTFKPVSDFQTADNAMKAKNLRDDHRISDRTRKKADEVMDADCKYVLNVFLSKIVHQILELGEDNIASLDEAADHDDLDTLFNLVGWIRDYNDNRLTFATSPNIQKDLSETVRNTFNNSDVKIYNESLIINTFEKFLRIVSVYMSIASWDDDKAKKATWHTIAGPMMTSRNPENWFECMDLFDDIKNDLIHMKDKRRLITEAKKKAKKTEPEKQ